jgi:peptide/nickel transport system permease protein
VGLGKVLAKRLAALGLVLFLVTFFSSMLLTLVPGDPVTNLVPVADGDPRADALKDRIREENHLDRSVPMRYIKWVGIDSPQSPITGSDGFPGVSLRSPFSEGVLSGDFGSYYQISGTSPIGERITSALPISLQLMAYAQILSLLIAIPLGVLAAYRSGRLFDRAANSAAFAVFAVPNFVLGLLLSFYVGVELGWLPANDYVPFGEDPMEHVRHMVLPAIALGASQVAVYMRLLRSDMVATLQDDFVQMARSKGISDTRVLWRHAFRPSSITLLTVAGLNVGTLIGGALIIEIIFDLPGMGSLIAGAINAREYLALQAFVAIVAIIYVLANFFVDFLYTVIDPRIRHARAA